MTAPSTSTAICQLLLVLSGGTAHDDVLRCRANAGPNTVGPRDVLLRVGDLSRDWVPGALLPRLEQDACAWSVDLPLRSARAGLVIGAVGVWFRFLRTYQNPKDPKRLTGKRWIWPAEEIDTAIGRASAWLPPTVVVDARSIVILLWALGSPLRGRTDDSAIIDLLRKVAARVGAIVPPLDTRINNLSIPLPGFTVPNATGGDSEIVRCPSLRVERVYTLREVEAALAAPASDTHGTPAAAPAHRRKER